MLRLFMRIALCVGVTVTLGCFLGAASAAESPLNLLRLPEAKLEWSTLPGSELARLAALTDGSVQTVATAEVAEAGPLDVIYGFADVVAPERLKVILPERGSDNEGAARVEILVSTLSAHSGFHSLRSDPLDPKQREQSFGFPATAARWIMVRLTPAPGSTRLAVAELEILGHPGSPRTQYAFAESPARAIDVLARLGKERNLAIGITSDERAAFNAPLEGSGFANLALIASGVLDPIKRQAYLRRLDDLERNARAAVASAKTTSEKGEKLLGWLHRGPMAKGYQSNQTDLSVLLDTGFFNCVSSATLYNILAVRLGLDVRAIEVPDHAFSVLYQGTSHMDVETTNASGFNPARDPRIAQQLERMTGFRYIPDSHRDQRREVDAAGLVAIIYYNHGVQLTEQKRYHEALLAYFRAMSLDPEFGSAVKNALATLANWSVELSQSKKWEDALEVVTTGLSLAPQDATLRNNQEAVWAKWAGALIDAGKRDEAIAVLKRAAISLPNANFVNMQAWVYIKPGEELVRAGQWEAALTLAQPRLAELDPAPAKELASWRQDLYLRWLNGELEAHRFETAAEVLARGLTAYPEDRRLRTNAGYLVQEWAKEAAARGAYVDGIAVLKRLGKDFGGIPSVAQASLSFVERNSFALAKQGRPEEALAALDQARNLLGEDKEVRRISVAIYDEAAQARMKVKAWEQAADLYAEALGRFPDEGLLKGNIHYLAQEWGKSAFEQAGVTGVAQAARAVAARFPRMPDLNETAANQVHNAVLKQVEDGEFAAALRFLDDAKPLFTQDKLQSLQEYAYDRWAKRRMATKDWSGVADVYVQAISVVGASDLLKNNMAYLAQEWGRDAYAAGGADRVVEAVDLAVRRFAGGPVPISVGGMVNGAVNEAVRTEQYEGAASLLKRVSSHLSKDEARPLFELAYDRWAKQRMAKKDWSGVADIYVQAIAVVGASDLLKNNMAYLAQEWGRDAYAAGGADRVVEAVDSAVLRFAGGPVPIPVGSMARGAVNEAVRTEQHEGAVSLLKRVSSHLSKDEARPLFELAYNRWAETFMSRKDWAGAIRIYDEGLQQLPGDGLFTNNRAYCVEKNAH